MKTGVYTLLALVLSVVTEAQVLDGDQQFPVLNKMRWDMSRENILALCAASRITTSGNDSTITFDSEFFSAPAKVIARFREGQRRPWTIEVKFQDPKEHIPDTLVNYFTRKVGKPPANAEQKKSALLFTLRVGLSMWKTATERITLLVGRRNNSVFEVTLGIRPVIDESESG